MTSNLLGNSHSTSASSHLASQRIENVRLRVLKLFNANPLDFDVVFVANATAGVKLVMETFRDLPDGFWYGYHRDAHTSLVGVRETAVRGSRCFTSDQDVESWLDQENDVFHARLFAYPAQSNFNGRRLPLDWCRRLRSKSHMYSLLDVASLVSTSQLDLSDAANAPDFTAFSFYKMFGFPDLGALIVRKDSSNVLRSRQYFGGGTVDMVTCLDEKWHVMKEDAIHSRLEDGTLPIHSIVALDCAISVHEQLYGGSKQSSAHASFLAHSLYQKLSSLKHSNGHPICEIYKDPASCYSNKRSQGPIIAFNLRDSRGNWISSHELQKLTAVKNIHLRAGGVCNPGGVTSSLGLSIWDLRKSYVSGFRCGNDNNVLDGKPMGVVRVSLGAMNILEDVEAFIDFIDEFFVDKAPVNQPTFTTLGVPRPFYIESLTVYPIKSCGGWEIPRNMSWTIKPEGLAWDREWCLIHQGTRAALSQKRYPRMALFKPTLDIANSRLHIRYTKPEPSSDAPSEISISLSSDPSYFMTLDSHYDDQSCLTNLCGDKIDPFVYSSAAITFFFSTHLRVPVFLARFPATRLESPLSRRHVKALSPTVAMGSGVSESYLDTIPGAFPTPPPSPPARPLLLSNESPILVVSRSSVNQLNKAVEASGGKGVEAAVFRANIVLAQATASPGEEFIEPETPFVEDGWSGMQFVRPQEMNDELLHEDGMHLSLPLDQAPYTQLEVLGACRRCQMVCVDQDTGEKNQEPFITLAKTRKWSGGVWFGVHASLAVTGAGNETTADSSVRVGNWVITW